MYLYKDGTTVYIIAYSHDENQKVAANEKSNVMFAQLSALTSVDAANLDTANVTDMNGMFMESGNIESVILSGLDTSKVENMSDMFKLCTGLSTLDLSGLSTESVSDMSAMFDGCSSLATIYASESFVIGPDTAHGNMFAGCGVLVGGMGTAFDAAHIDKAYAHIDGGSENPGYFTARYVVTLDPNNGDDPTEIVVTGGEEASFTIPQDEPTQDGYSFSSSLICRSATDVSLKDIFLTLACE